MNNPTSPTIWLLLLTLCLSSNPAWTQEPTAPTQTTQDPDNQEPIEIQADQLQISNKQGKSIYTGHVIITQGSLEIKGDKVILIHPQQTIQKVEVFGKPAYFKKYLAHENKWLKGHAHTIIYQANRRTIRLTGQAFLQQGTDNQISGPDLHYDLKQQTLQAKPTHKEKTRIHIIIQPTEKAP